MYIARTKVDKHTMQQRCSRSLDLPWSGIHTDRNGRLTHRVFGNRRRASRRTVLLEKKQRRLLSEQSSLKTLKETDFVQRERFPLVAFAQ